ncbi:MAG: hypothetical protein CSB02_01090 [Bacteroidia bacterium]|nr:MAG: hypothetical protein CSB02_01090 [Bacteroidia bacterium]
MTSNTGSDLIQRGMEEMTEANREAKLEAINHQVMALLRKSMRPEFLNRVDDIVMFSPLTLQEIKEIIRLQFEQLKAHLHKNNLELGITDAAIDLMAKQSYDPQYGARPIKRYMQQHIINELSKRILADELSKEQPILIDAKDNALVFETGK